MEKLYKITPEAVDLMWPTDNEDVKCYMRMIIQDLSEQYKGEIPQYLMFSLDLLADQIRVYKKAQREFVGKPVVMGSGDRKYQNPLVGIIRESQKQIMNLCKEMNLTAFTKKRDKIMSQKLEKGEDQEATAQELLDQLIN